MLAKKNREQHKANTIFHLVQDSTVVQIKAGHSLSYLNLRMTASGKMYCVVHR